MELGEFSNLARSAMTVISLLTFLGIVVWAYSGRRKKAYEEAANVPFDNAQELPSELESAQATKMNKGMNHE